jgi:hypothetical protein
MDDARRALAKVIARAWTDDTFRQWLHKDPVAALQDSGLKVPEGAKVHIHENTAKDVHVVIPTKPEGSLQNIASLAAAYTHADLKPYTIQDL